MTSPRVGDLDASPAFPVTPIVDSSGAQPAAVGRGDVGRLVAQDRGPVGGDDSHDDGVGTGLGGAGVAERVRGHPGMLGEASDASRCGRFRGMAAMLEQSPLHDRHVALGAKLAEFGGWSMPLEYPTGVVKEHTAVREAVGIFDVSHLGKAMVTGTGRRGVRQRDALQRPAQDRARQGAVHAVLDAETGGIVDDLIAYYHDDEHVLLVPNAANTAEVVRRLREARTRGRQRRRPPPRLRRAGRAGTEVRRGARGDRTARPGTTT